MPTDAIRKPLLEQVIEPLRKELESKKQVSIELHTGLMLDRYLPQHDDEHTGAKQLYELAQQTEASPVYKSAFSRWRQSLQRLEGVRLFTATAASPIAVGLGNESVLEVGLTVHRTYGVPIIPGSALKGLCRRSALQLRREGKLTDEQFRVLFGYSEDNGCASAGYIVFWDAWYDPDSAGGKPFHRDTITVHHADYYSSRGQAYPTDFDDPNPVPFLVVRPGARFLFGLQAPQDGWGEFAEHLLKWSIQYLGVGAKTNAGYGYFAIDEGKVDTSPAKPVQSAKPIPVDTSTDTWQNVVVSYNPGQRVLQVQRTIEGRSEGASADAQRTQQLLSTLPEAARQKLTQGKRRLLADVQIEVSGNRKLIVKIAPRE